MSVKDRRDGSAPRGRPPGRGTQGGSVHVGTLVWQVVVVLTGALLLAFLILPVFALIVTASVPDFVQGLTSPAVALALKTSLVTTGVSLGIIVLLGTPLAWILARRGGGRVTNWLEALVQLPIVTPPAVAGVALLLAFGRQGLIGGWLAALGWAPVFTGAAVVMAQVFVAAPFFLRSAITAFRGIDETLLRVGRSLGASPPRIFFRLGLPLAAQGLTNGAAMSWARALGEFGATLMFAGNLPGRTQTLPLAIYTALESDLRVAQSISLILVFTAFILLLVLHRRTLPGVSSPAPSPAAGGRGPTDA